MAAGRGRIYDDITQTIGNTPLIKLRRVVGDAKGIVVAKLENFNPLWSVKDRIGVAMIDAGEKAGKITKDTVIIEPTSGNTGIGLAFTCAARGYKLIVTMPESMSLERRRLLKAFGAEIVLTPRERGMTAPLRRPTSCSRAIRNRSCRSNSRTPPIPKSIARPRPRRSGTTPRGKSISSSPASARGARSTGVSEVLKAKKPSFKAIAVEPVNSPVITQKMKGQPMTPSPHRIQGIGAGFIPGVLNIKIIDEVIQVKDDDAFDIARRLAKEEGMLCGISCGAATWAAIEVAKRPENAGKLIVVVLPDLGERYLSTPLFPE